MSTEKQALHTSLEDAGSLPLVEFKIVQVNLNRMRRGAEAVEIAVYEDGEKVAQLWMSKRDVVRNIRQWGQCDAFSAALEIYRTGRDVREANKQSELTVRKTQL